MEYYNFSKSARLLSIKSGRGVRIVKLNVGKGVLSEADKEAVVVGNKPTAEALILAKSFFTNSALKLFDPVVD